MNNQQGAYLAPLAGHLLDLYRLVTFDIRNPCSVSKARQIKALRRRVDARMLIETGTFLGNTTRRCSRAFEKVITVELDHDLFERSRRFLQRCPNVECIEGDALKKLPEIMARPDVQDALIFLDGHFSGGITALGDMPEPACEEISLLAQFKLKIRGFIVDDFREFGEAKGWPRRSELLRSIEDSFSSDFDYTVHMDQVVVWRRRAQ